MVVTSALIPPLRALGLRRGLVDGPGRKTQARPVPYLGGVAIVAAVIATLSTVQTFEARLAGVAAAAMLLGVVGLLDDRHPLGVDVRLAAEVAAAAVVTAGGVQVLVTDIPAVDVVLTIIWLVAITNALNLLDNMDGVAGSVALLSAVGIAAPVIDDGQRVIAVGAAGLAGACAGFLVFNARRASIYLGDSGALFVGFVLAVLSVEVNSALANPGSFLIPIGLLGIAILDSALVTVLRLRRGVSPFTVGRDHLAHRLLAGGYSPGRALVGLSGAHAVMVALAVLAGVDLLVLGAVVLGWAVVVAAFWSASGRRGPPEPSDTDDVVDGLVEGPGRGPTGQAAQPAGVGDPSPHVLEVGAEGVLVGLEDDGRRRPGPLQDPVGEVHHRDLVLGADVEDLTRAVGVVQEDQQGPDHVLDVAEAAGLAAVAVHGERRTVERLADQGGQDHAVVTPLAGPDGVEQTHHGGGQTVLAVVGQRQDLVDGLRGRVGPAGDGGRAQDPVGILRERDLGVAAVDLRAAGDQEAAAVSIGRGEHVLGAADVAGQGLEGLLHDEAHPHGGGEVDHGVTAGGGLVDDGFVEH